MQTKHNRAQPVTFEEAHMLVAVTCASGNKNKGKSAGALEEIYSTRVLRSGYIHVKEHLLRVDIGDGRDRRLSSRMPNLSEIEIDTES